MKNFNYSFEDVPCNEIIGLSGWYYWYIDWVSVFKYKPFSVVETRSFVENIIRFYGDKVYKSDIGNIDNEFGDKFSGVLESKWNVRFDLEKYNIDALSSSRDSFNLWLELITELRIPIYFGESGNIFERMKQHAVVLSDPNYSGNESFGKRFNNRRKKFSLDKYLKPSNLRVRVFVSDTVDIVEIERLINLVIKPISGFK